MKTSFVVPMLVIALLFIGVLVYSQRSRLLSVPNPTVTPTVGPTISQGGNGSPQPTQTTDPITSPGISPTGVSSEANIKVYAPRTTDNVGPNFTVSGEARVFENALQVRVTNPDTNEVLYNEPIMANAPDIGQFGPFSAEVDLSGHNLQPGDDLLLEAFQYSAKDGSEIDKVQVPLVY